MHRLGPNGTMNRVLVPDGAITYCVWCEPSLVEWACYLRGEMSENLKPFYIGPVFGPI